MPRPPLELDAVRTAVLVSECQDNVIGRHTNLPALRDDLGDLIPNVARLTTGVRAGGGHVVFLNFVPDDSTPHRTTAPLFAHATNAMTGWTKEDPQVQVVDGIPVDPGDTVEWRAAGMNPAYRTEVLSALRADGVDTVVVVGVSVNIAVPVIATQVGDEGFRVVVATDAVAGTPRDYAAAVLQNTVALLARLATTDEVLAALR